MVRSHTNSKILQSEKIIDFLLLRGIEGWFVRAGGANAGIPPKWLGRWDLGRLDLLWVHWPRSACLLLV